MVWQATMKMCPIKEWVARDGTFTGGPLTQLYTVYRGLSHNYTEGSHTIHCIVYREGPKLDTFTGSLTQLYRGLFNTQLYNV